MPLLDKKSGNPLYSVIEEINSPDYRWIQKSEEFRFNWEFEKDNEVYKISLADRPEDILGLMSLIDHPEEYRIHLNLIEVGKSNRGRSKSVENIAGCLIAFACKMAFDRDYFGFVSLQPKTELIELYKKKYGFIQYGRLLAVEQELAKYLIDEYLNDEEERKDI